MHYTPSDKERAMALSIVGGVMTLPDGRELCITDKAYNDRIQVMVARQHGQCAMCQLQMGIATFEHEAGKGMGNSMQDDRLTHPDGTWMNAAVDMFCNSLKGSRRFRWVDGRYQEVV